MTDADHFLAAIIADPDSDVPRLVFADWLEENGDADRAEFIRVQCAFVREPYTPAQRQQVEARAAALLAPNRKQWWIPDIPGSQTFRRGFVEHLHISAADFLQYEAMIAQAAPVIELRFSVTEHHTTALTGVPWLARLRSLEITNDTIGSRLRDLFRPNLFPELRTLILRNNRLWAEYVATLTQLTENFPNLDRLDLSGNPIGDEGFGHIVNAASMRGLRELILRSDDVDYEYRVHASGMAAFARSEHVRRLRVLSLAGQNIGDAGLIALVGSPNAAALEVLDVSRNEIGDVGAAWAEAVVTSPHLGRLRELNVSRSTIDLLAAMELARWPHLATGCVVRLHGVNWSQKARTAVENSPFREQFDISERYLP